LLKEGQTMIETYLQLAPAITAVEITAAAAMLASWVWPGGQSRQKC